MFGCGFVVVVLLLSAGFLGVWVLVFLVWLVWLVFAILVSDYVLGFGVWVLVWCLRVIVNSVVDCYVLHVWFWI